MLAYDEGGSGVSCNVNGLEPSDTLCNRYRGLGMSVSVFIEADGVGRRVHNGLLRLSQMEDAFAEALQSGAGGDKSVTGEPSD